MMIVCQYLTLLWIVISTPHIFDVSIWNFLVAFFISNIKDIHMFKVYHFQFAKTNSSVGQHG
jgi:hypothetical protein